MSSSSTASGIYWAKTLLVKLDLRQSTYLPPNIHLVQREPSRGYISQRPLRGMAVQSPRTFRHGGGQLAHLAPRQAVSILGNSHPTAETNELHYCKLLWETMIY